MKEDFRKQIFKNTLLVFLALIAGISIFLWYSSANNSKKQDLEKNISKMNEDTTFYRDAKKSYTVDEVKKELVEANINVPEKMDSSKTKLINGLHKVYDDTKTQEQYEKLQKKIQDDLGEDFSKTLLKLSKPVVNQSGKPIFPYDSMTDNKIAFGKYDISSKLMKCYVLVYWKSPILDATNTGIKTEKKEVRIAGKDFFVMDYRLEDDSFKIIDYQHTIDSEVASHE